MREALKKVRPDRFDDLVALNALYRPGAMDQIPTYARGKRNPESISYPDERLRPILGSSMGVILYQEQAMRIATEIAGFSGAKADDLRKAIGKKNREAMAQAQARVRRRRARERHLRRRSSTSSGRPTRSRPTTPSTAATPRATR